MIGRNLSVAQCTKSLDKKGVKAILENGTILLSIKKNSLGNKSWGMVDFLCNYCNCNYIVVL